MLQYIMQIHKTLQVVPALNVLSWQWML